MHVAKPSFQLSKMMTKFVLMALLEIGGRAYIYILLKQLVAL